MPKRVTSNTLNTHPCVIMTIALLFLKMNQELVGTKETQMQNSVRWTIDICKLHRQWDHYKNVTLTATLNMEEHNGLNVWDVTCLWVNQCDTSQVTQAQHNQWFSQKLVLRDKLTHYIKMYQNAICPNRHAAALLWWILWQLCYKCTLGYTLNVIQNIGHHYL